MVASAGTALATHTWRSATAGNLGGWQIARSLFFLNVLTGSVGTPGGTHPNGWDKFIAHFPQMPPPQRGLEREALADRVPAHHQRDVDPAAAPPARRRPRARSTSTSARVYNPLWINPDGFTWIDVPQGRVQDRPARRPDPDLERVGHVRRLRAADGPCVGAARHDVLRDPHLQVDRLPAAGRPRRDGQEGHPLHRQPGRQPRRGVGGERVLVRAVLGDRPGRVARHPPVVRVAGATRASG